MIMNQDKVLAYCERKNTRVIKREWQTLILENWDILEVTY